MLIIACVSLNEHNIVRSRKNRNQNKENEIERTPFRLAGKTGSVRPRLPPTRAHFLPLFLSLLLLILIFFRLESPRLCNLALPSAFAAFLSAGVNDVTGSLSRTRNGRKKEIGQERERMSIYMCVCTRVCAYVLRETDTHSAGRTRGGEPSSLC